MGEETKGTKWGDCWATRRDSHVGGASWAETKVDEDPEVNTAIYPRVKETQPEMVTVTLWTEVQASGEQKCISQGRHLPRDGGPK